MTRRANRRLFLCLLLGIGLAVATGLGPNQAVARPPADAADPSTGTAPSSSITIEQVQGVLAQATALAQRLEAHGNAERLQPLVARLQELAQSLPPAQPTPATTASDLTGVYAEACQVARRIAFCNPLLNFDKLLFLKRHDSAGVYHMCDQFYGCNARPGGGLFVLENPWSDQPQVRNLLENSVVQNGRLQGQKLDTGTFLSPELSFDGTTILFAYSQAKAWEKYGGKECYEWTPEYSYHIFRCDADGQNLVQLTDGDWDDFDPCFLPNGRIAFISERRGGYLRCGRHCPVYTLHSMNADGSDMIRLSFHETHEWHPSVTNDGMLVYTRWDYVDRDTNIAHHIWTCYPDGRDPRTPHGNYPQNRESRPWMEMDIRAIPNSQKFVAVTGAHHGNALGSLVMIDPGIIDDNAQSQLTRITPDTPFPEAEGGTQNISKFSRYGTPWPLSEDDYLCVYDVEAKNRGIYWIDRFGNRQLLYRDPAISCLSPIPLRSRPRPPVLPDLTVQTAVAAVQHPAPPTATISVVSVYDSDFEWPEHARVTALRIVQVLPKTTPPPNVPRIGVAEQTNARAVLGTVPVEEDGSVYFEAPAGKEIYFQAVDARGMAIQSMRSGTYLHPGEQLSCQGCHERRRQGPDRSSQVPLAMRRSPSKITPDTGGSNPFNYVRLVQDVLDRNCVECHRAKAALDLTGVVEGPYGWTRSYNNLASKYGFYFHVTNGAIRTGVHGGARTIAGQFGARAAGLLEYLSEKHYGVKLSEEDLHRITLWLDCNSEFFGAYENTAAQSLGQVVQPSLD
ncbi:MAG: HzsA-related protein [Pirellulaceae bacterium]